MFVVASICWNITLVCTFEICQYWISADRLDRTNSLYGNEGERSQLNAPRSTPVVHHGDAGPKLIRLEGFSRSEAVQLLDNRMYFLNFLKRKYIFIILLNQLSFGFILLSFSLYFKFIQLICHYQS